MASKSKSNKKKAKKAKSDLVAAGVINLGGRPRIEIAPGTQEPLTPTVVQALASIGCTIDEMAMFFGVSRRTMFRRLRESEFREAYELGTAFVKMSLRRKLLDLVDSGSTAAAIFLAKNMLGMSDHGPVEVEINPSGVRLRLGTQQRQDVLDLLEHMPEPSDKDRKLLEKELIKLREQYVLSSGKADKTD